MRDPVRETDEFRVPVLALFSKQEVKMAKAKNAKSSKAPPKSRSANRVAAGIDLGAREHYAAVPNGAAKRTVRKFRTTTSQLRKLVSWLLEAGVTTVAMESTGIYWIPLFELLEESELEVYLVNATHLKNVPGRKTDVQDCQWIQRLHSNGLLCASFRPPLQICELRTYVRHRENLTQQASRHILHMQKAMTLMNLRLDTVVSDITGATGLAIIRDILAGNEDPVELAKHRNPGCRSSEEDIAEALTGHYRDDHLFLLRAALCGYEFFVDQMHCCDEQIERVLREFGKSCPMPESPVPDPRTRKKQGNEPRIDLRSPLFRLTGSDLTQIHGIGPFSALKIIAEIGIDMTSWRSSKHFTSWLGLAPGNNITGGKRRPAPSCHGTHRAGQHFRISAMALGRSDTMLGAFYRRTAARRGAAKAVTATARKLAILVYNSLKHGIAYADGGAEEYERRFQQRNVSNLKKRARRLGFKLVAVEDGPSATAVAGG